MNRQPADGARRALRFLLAVLLVLVAAHLVRLTREAAFRPLTLDDFIDLHNAWLVKNGKPPWLHAFTVHPTLQSFPLSWLMGKGDENVEIQRSILWVVFAMDLAIFALVFGHFWILGRRKDAIVALFLVTSSTLLLQHLGDIRPETAALFCLILGVELAAVTVVRGPAYAALFVSGILVGCSCLMNQKCVLLGAGFAAFFVLAGPLAVSFLRTLAFSAGVAVPIVLFAVYLVRAGALDAFYQMNFVLPFKMPLPSHMWQKVMSVSFLGPMLSLNFFFVFCCLWAFKWALSIALRRELRAPDGGPPADPILWPDLPWPPDRREERLLVSCLAAVSLSFMLANPFPHLYNYLLMGPFLILMAAPCVTAALESFCARPRAVSSLVLIAGFAIGDVLLPLRVSRHGLDGHVQQRELERIHAMVPANETIFDSSLRFYRPQPTKIVPVVAFTGILASQGILPPVAQDLVRARCRFVYWDEMMEGYLLPVDQQFIRRNYVPIEGGLLGLGRRIEVRPAGALSLTVPVEVPARYRVRLEPAPGGATVEPVEIDGRTVQTGDPVDLDTGDHRLVLRRTARTVVLTALDPVPPK